MVDRSIWTDDEDAVVTLTIQALDEDDEDWDDEDLDEDDWDDDDEDEDWDDDDEEDDDLDDWDEDDDDFEGRRRPAREWD